VNYHRCPLLKTIIACILACFCCGVRPNGAEIYRKAVQAFRDGKFTQALDLARATVQRCEPRSECHWSARLLEAEIRLTDRQPDEAAAVLSEESLLMSQFAALAARRIWLQGDLEVERKHPELAAELYAKARQMASSAEAWDVVSEIDLSRAILLFASHHDTEGATAIFRGVAEQSARRQNAYYEAVALNGLGMIRLKDWRFDEAIPWFQRSMEAARSGGGQRLIVVAGHNLGICYLQLGSFDEAVKSLQSAINLLGESGLATYRTELLRQMGNTLFLEGEALKAIGYFRQAAALARTGADAARCYRALALAYTSIQDWNAAEQSNNKAVSYGNDEASRPWAEKNQAAIAEGRGKYDEACSLYRKTIADAKSIPAILWELHAALAGIYTKTGDYRRADEEFANTIRIIDDNVEKISTQEYSLTFFALQIGFYQGYIRALIARHSYQRALEIADSSRARLLFQRLALRRKPEIITHALDYLSIARRLNSVLLFYLVDPEQSYLWVVTPTGVHPPIPLPPAEQIRRWVKQYSAFIEQRLGDPMTTANEAGRHLYDALIGPAESFIPRDSRVILIPDDALNWLNFETLPVYGNSSGEQPHYWIDDVRVEIAPSLKVLSADKPLRPHRPHSLLIIGDPVSASREFPALAFAAKEIETIEANFPATEKRKFTGPLARPGVYRTAGPGRFSLLHFSAHAVANKESPLDSAIILSPDGDNFKLYARNVIDIPLRADLVTISACHSAGARSFSGEGLVGFAWAFLQAGAHNVIAGLWDVTDSSTPDIMGVLYSKIAAGVSPADALRTAKLNLVHSGKSYRRPYYWGPFQIYTR
jgi:CHAT domain-containing protein